MLQYLLPFLAYILPAIFIKNIYISYIIRIALTALLLFLYRKRYILKLRFNFLSILIGIAIFLIWLSLPFSYINEKFIPVGYMLIVKIIGFNLITPIIEELFTRDFLIRQTIAIEKKKSISKIGIGEFTPFSFIVSILFFGFSHNMWLAGILSALLLNLLLYKNKSIGDCIVAHALANIILTVYIVYTKSWFLW